MRTASSSMFGANIAAQEEEIRVSAGRSKNHQRCGKEIVVDSGDNSGDSNLVIPSVLNAYHPVCQAKKLMIIPILFLMS